MENVKIYEIKASAQDNYLVLRSIENLFFYWNDAKFVNNEPGDYVFVVNRTGKEALFTRLAEKKLDAIYDADTDTSRFSDHGSTYNVRGKWERFIRFEILELKTLEPDWNWTTMLGSSEIYDLWKKNEDLVGQVNRIEKIDDLERIFTEGKPAEILQQCTELIRGASSLLPEITDALQNSGIQSLIREENFIFQKGKDKLDELIAFRPANRDEEFYENLTDQVDKKEDSFIPFLNNFPEGSDEYKLLKIIGELVAYCDAKAAGKQELNQYADKRTVAHSAVRQTTWVLNLLKYKAHNCDLNAISSPAIRNAISYLLTPAAGLAMLSEDHRKMATRYLLRTAYDTMSFIPDILRFFERYGIHPVNQSNLTRIISDVLYTQAVKNIWFKKIGGLVVADSTGGIEDAIEEMESSKKMVLWWDKLPSGGTGIQKLLREQIREQGFFHIYYTKKGEAYSRSRIIDFAVSEDYADKNWNAGGDVGWYKNDFNDYTSEGDGKTKKARIVFLADEVVPLKRNIPYDQFEFYKNYQPPVQNNMQPYAEVMEEIDDIIIADSDKETVEEEVDNVILAPTVDFIEVIDNPEDPEYKQQQAILQILMAIKTKPFVLLAGISGTGKSRLVRSLAYKTCAIPLLQEGNPLNFLMIQVKPNWNDSTELLGYVSEISGHPKYKTTLFIKFLLRAWRYPQIPFFVCMDEMNLAPVELYMAEYLSAIESRRYKNDDLLTDPLVPAGVFKKFNSDEFWKELDIPNQKKLQDSLMKNGLGIPHNLVVIGTVNMDETTHSFSRKVLDRAMTIEMNEVDLRAGLKAENLDWEYPAQFYSKKLVCGVHTSAGEVYSLFNEGKEVLDLLIEVNEALDKTPFKIAYRVRDESLIYCYHYSLLKRHDENPWLNNALDEIIRMKILSRIEGDETKCTDVLNRLRVIFERHELDRCADKVDEMIDRLRFGSTSFFP